MAGFKPSIKITQPELLFGRNKKGQLLDTLILNIKRGSNCQLQGEKRSGKTSVLKCLKTILEKDYPQYIVLFIDFKEIGVANNRFNVYRVLLSKLIFKLSCKNLLNDENKIKNFAIRKCNEWEDVYQNLQDVPDIKVQGILKEFILFYSEYYNIGFVLLFDEYEHLLTVSFDDPTGFMVLRNLADEGGTSDIKPLTYIIAGSKSWERLCTEIGSPELNNCGVGINFTSPLKVIDFQDMWEYSLSHAGEILNEQVKDTSLIYEKSGGFPFFAKKIAESANVENGIISDVILKEDFSVMLRNLNERERHFISDLLKNKNTGNKIIGVNLVDRGICKSENAKFKINGSLWENYLKNFLIEPYDQSSKSLIIEEVEKIHIKMTKINKTYKNNRIDYPFELIDNENELRQSMQGEIFSEFTSAIYKTVFERTMKNNKKLETLPRNFRRNNDFVSVIDSLRHEFGGHLTSSSSYQPSLSQYNRTTLLVRLKGDSIEPNSKELINIQIKVLKEFNTYLEDIIIFLKTNKPNKWQ